MLQHAPCGQQCCQGCSSLQEATICLNALLHACNNPLAFHLLTCLLDLLASFSHIHCCSLQKDVSMKEREQADANPFRTPLPLRPKVLQ